MNNEDIENAISPDSIAEKLLPCPFCGQSEFFRVANNSWGRIWVSVKCDGCGAQGSDVPLTEEEFDNQDFKAVYANWQNRTA